MKACAQQHLPRRTRRLKNPVWLQVGFMEVPRCMRKTFIKPEQRQQSVEYKPSSELAEFVPITPDEKLVFALVNRYAPEYGIDPKLVLAVIKQESNFNPAARSSKNAQGLMQLIPETAARFNVKRPFDPEQNMCSSIPRCSPPIRQSLRAMLTAYPAAANRSAR